jgi:glucokinase
MTAPNVVGIDIGGTAVKVARPDRIAGTWRTATSDRYARPDRDTLARALRDAAERADAAGLGAAAVGLCVPGIPSADGSRIELSVNVPGLMGWDFRDLTAEALGGRPAAIVRLGDAEAATTDWAAAHGSSGRIAGIAIGTGVGLAVLDDGVPLRCCDGGAGHIGQIDVTIGPPELAPIGPDGGRGGLEAYAGAAAVTAAGSIDRAFAPGSDALAAVARTIRIVHAIYRPATVLLLGGIGRRIDLGILRPAIDEHLTRVALSGWRLVSGDDDHHAARGAARAAGA